jgi:hypothetical protein
MARRVPGNSPGIKKTAQADASFFSLFVPFVPFCGYELPDLQSQPGNQSWRETVSAAIQRANAIRSVK